MPSKRDLIIFVVETRDLTEVVYAAGWIAVNEILSRGKTDAAFLVSDGQGRAAITDLANHASTSTHEVKISVRKCPEGNIAGRWCCRDEPERRIKRNS